MNDHTIPLDPACRADDPHDHDAAHEVLPDVAYQRLLLVNVAFVGPTDAGDRGWVLVDAGIPGSATSIAKAAAQRYGEAARPAAVVLTHGHFDHVGGLLDLAARWGVPVYCHPLEKAYLDGTASYPPPDPTVGGGLMARLAPFYPRGPITVGDRLDLLPDDGTVPPLPGWRWLPTPGHTPGHVSLWREVDRTLIVGDAFISTAQESAYAVATQALGLHGPPMYYTQDWAAAKASVERLAALEPEVAVTGHGRPVRGDGLRAALHQLARDFDRVAVPEQGKYVGRPAKAADGSAYPRA